MKWIKVKDQLPVQNKKVLLYCPEYDDCNATIGRDEFYFEAIIVGYYTKREDGFGDSFYCECDSSYPVYPTHWMNLPPKPKARKLHEDRK